MPVDRGGGGAAGGASGGGGGAIGGLLRQTGEDDKGIHISHRQGDLSWHMQAEAAAVGEDAVSAAMSYRGAGSGNSLKVTFDTPAAGNAKGFIPLLGSGDVESLTHLPEAVNTYDIFHFQYDAPDVNPRSAFIDWGAVRVTSAKTADAGNTDWLTIGGRSRLPASLLNAKVRLNGNNGPGTSGGKIDIRSPNVPKSRVIRIYSASTARIRVTQTVAGNGVDTIAFQYGSDVTAGTPDVSYRNSGGATNTMLVRLNGNTSYDAIIAAINAETDSTQSNKKHLFAEGWTTTTGASYSNVGVNFQNAGSYASGAGHALGALQGGGAGAGTNTGWVRVITSAARTDEVRPGLSVNVAAPGDSAETIRIERLDAFKNTTLSGNITVSASAVGANNKVTIIGASNSLNITIRGTVTLQAIVDAFGTGVTAFGRMFGARLVSAGDASNTVTWQSGVDNDRPYANPSLSGGSEGMNLLTATYDVVNNQLSITCLATDTFTEIIAEVAKLSQFQAGDGTSPGDVWITDNGNTTGLGTHRLDVQGTAGQFFSYNFAGGRDAITREPLVVTDAPDFHFNPNTLYINKWLRTDTVQDLIDAYSGSQFTITAPSGNTTDLLDGPLELRVGSSTAQLSGGRGPVTRQLPTVSLIEATAGTASYSVFYHGSETTGASRTTLAELKDAWDNVLGNNRPLSPDTVTVTGDGSVVVRNAGIPSAPSGGRNFVSAGLNEAEARPLDEVDGPNILVKYSTDDDLDTVIEHFRENNNGGFTFTMVYGTDGSAAPEDPPFSRDFYARPPTTRATGPTDGLTQNEVDARVRALTKGYAQAGGGQVPDSDIPDDIARDSEIPTPVPFSESLFSDGTPSASDNDELPFFTAAGALNKATSQVWRAKFKGWVGEWNDTPGSFVFREGDVTMHDGQVYVVTAQTTKNPNSGPNVHTAFQLIHQWAGAWKTGWYKAGSMATYSGGLYVANAIVINTDGAPNASTKWTRLDSANGSFVGLSLTGNTLTLTDRGGTDHTVTLPSQVANVTANPAGSDGDVLKRIAIGGENYVVDADVPVGAAMILGRVTSTTGKYPSDLPDHTDPIRVPNPVSRWEDPDVPEDLVRIEASISWPVIPLNLVQANGGFLSNLDTTEHSVEVAEGMYIIGARVQNVWIDGPVSTRPSSTTAVSLHRPNYNQRLSIELLIEMKSGADWVELSRSNSPYTRGAPFNCAPRTGAFNASVRSSINLPVEGNPGSVDGSSDPAYDGVLSPVAETIFSVVAVPSGGAELRFRLERGNVFASQQIAPTGTAGIDPARAGRDDNIEDGLTPWGYYADVPSISMFPLGRPTQSAPIVVHPHIGSFEIISGNVNPVAGSIAGNTFGYSYTIAQGGHVGAARIIGFEGATKPQGSATVLATLTDFNLGAGTVDIPSNITLAADEFYTLRLQVFDAGVTPTADTEPVGYHDIRITAHAAATANYHWGRIVVDSGDADAAATAARVVFADDDITTGNAIAASYTAAPPSMGTDLYQFYLAVKDGSPEPVGWNSAGLAADSAFQAAVTRTISSVDWKFFITTADLARASADGSITYSPRTS